VFNHLRGRLVEKQPGLAVIEAGGVGYLLHVSLSTYEGLPGPGADCRLLTRLLVREDAQELVGFGEAAEREVFDALLSVSGVGMRLALAVLSAMRPGELVEAVRREDLVTLRRVKGLGAKKAERVILELRGRIDELAAAGGPAAPARTPAAAADAAAAALVNLGLSRGEAEAAASAAERELGPGAPLADLIRRALTHAR